MQERGSWAIAEVGVIHHLSPDLYRLPSRTHRHTNFKPSHTVFSHSASSPISQPSETIGDVVATEEASRITCVGPEHITRVKGGLRNDWFSCFFAAIAGTMPITTFAQNNGVISLTGVASRGAGFACAFWLMLLGIFGKFGGWVLSIPNCVLGGMTTYLFANVITSGIKLLIAKGPISRRDRVILAWSLGLGIGLSIVPQW